MIFESAELNAGLALIFFGLMLGVPNLEIIGLIGVDLSQYSSGVHTFIRLGLLLFSINFLKNAANAGER